MNAPTISKPLLHGFMWYSRRYLRRHFNSLRVTQTDNLHVPEDLPLVIYSNHASWWDPLAGLLLTRELFPNKNVFVPMDAAALERYGFFKRLGAFGVEQNTRRGAAQFLRTARTVLRTPTNARWLTPQSRFADVRERPAPFKFGIGHLPTLSPQVFFQPVAIEYTFWEERLPEILVRFGEPYRATAEDESTRPERWIEFFADRLRETQDEFARQAQRRDTTEFQCLLRGHVGAGGVYDRWRALKAKWAGQKLQLEHGKL